MKFLNAKLSENTFSHAIISNQVKSEATIISVKMTYIYAADCKILIMAVA